MKWLTLYWFWECPEHLSLHVGGLLRREDPTYTGHLVQVQLVSIEAVAGVAFSHANAATVFTAIQDSTFLRPETLKAIVALWWEKKTHHIIKQEALLFLTINKVW